ncbi:MAG: hypothetical protein H5T49_02910 [Hadesarchaea archaeon]|nr:hypothetical protein [Hadesarchaea archaeon]
MRIEEYVAVYRQILETLQRAGIRDPEAARVILQELGKDRRAIEAAEERRLKGTEEPATERQRKFLERRGVVFPRDISKTQASEIIARLTAQTSAK